MPIPTMTSVAASLTGELLTRSGSRFEQTAEERLFDASSDTEPGFEIAQSMGIALLGLVVAAAFATALEALGVDVITRIRTELGL